MKLHAIAHGRSGDKGNKANVAVIAGNPDEWGFLKTHLTEEYVADVFSSQLEHSGPESVDRYELPNIKALNFVLHDALGGGAGQSLRTDSQGKTFAALLLRQNITEEYYEYHSSNFKLQS